MPATGSLPRWKWAEKLYFSAKDSHEASIIGSKHLCRELWVKSCVKKCAKCGFLANGVGLMAFRANFRIKQQNFPLNAVDEYASNFVFYEGDPVWRSINCLEGVLFRQGFGVNFSSFLIFPNFLLAFHDPQGFYGTFITWVMRLKMSKHKLALVRRGELFRGVLIEGIKGCSKTVERNLKYQ